MKKIFFLAVLFSYVIIAQGNYKDDPRFDYQPVNFNPSPRAASEVVTIDGFDNFKLGTDFAEPHMSVNPLNPTEYFNAFNTNGAHYTMDGFEWENITPNFGNSMRGDPVTAYDNNGNLYYMNMYGSFSINGSLVLKSTDNGQTWNSAVNGIDGVDKCWIAADQSDGPYSGYVYCVMTASSGGNFTRSINQGTSFQNTNNFNTQSLPGMMVAVGPNVAGIEDIPGGCVYVVTNGGSTFSSTYTFYVSYDGGATFTQKSSQNFANYVGTNSNGRHSVNNMRTRPYPFITADNSNGPFRGRLYLTYASNTPAGNGNKPDIFLRYSDDQGATWSSAKIVNDDPETEGNHQFMPSFWCDMLTGRLFIKWMDTREDPTSNSAYIYATYSDNGGETFAENQRISNEPMIINCTTCGGGGTPRYQGDYDAITSYGNIGMAVWSDFRDGSFDSYTGYFPDYAMMVSPANQILSENNDTTAFSVNIPEVKLYDYFVKFSADISPVPSDGSILFEFVDGDTLFQVPGTKTLRVISSGFVPAQDYQITVTGEGPNGIPIHKREVSITIEPVNGGITNVSVIDGWNMVSVPRLTDSMSVSSLFPTAVSNAFAFNNGYVSVNELNLGNGYWIKFNDFEQIPIQGDVQNEIINLQEGWNLIGPFNNSIDVNNITTIPDNIIGSVFYGFNGAYQITSNLLPGKGYWVKAEAEGQMFLEPVVAKNNKTNSNFQIKESWTKLIITDANGKKSELYLSDDNSDLTKFILPPLPPSGSMDVRFRTGRMAEKLSIHNTIIDVLSAQYPIQISSEGANLILTSGKNNFTMVSGNSITLNEVSDLSVRFADKPVNFELSQNFPNPFNPTTIIKFNLPENSSVKLEIFNVLGELISTLADETLDAGFHQFSFDAGNLSSGVYFYKISAESFSGSTYNDIKKMAFIK